jgi:uracil-DNA glycosylase
MPAVQDSLFSDEALHGDPSVGLAQLKERALACHACKLAQTRKNVVFGAGNPNRPKIAFVGEGPGATEDAQGVPFVGPAGQLLNKMILKMGLDREQDCYVLNVVNCRPPDNRTPETDETVACRPYFHGQLRLIRPQVIITLGTTATTNLLQKQKAMKDFRGKWFEWENIPVRPTFHPSYLLRTPKDRATAMIDLDAVTLFLRTGQKSVPRGG